ncbi:hypothetical protein ABS71_15220 [bacterium SCN 62-11]|nr:MAG: hypothetical protein ABS71_15220 [bacterium SCN 62-11]
MVDARIVARQIAWAATTPEARNQAFNVANGDVSRWDWMWEQLAGYFGLEVAEYPGEATPLVDQMKDAGPDWESIVKKYDLRSYPVDQLAPWWHTDADLCRPFEAFMDLSKSRELGFWDSKKSSNSFFAVFDKLRQERIIP